MAAVETVTALARALERGRDRYNTRFAQAGRVDGEEFKRHLLEVVAPIAEAVDRVRAERTDAVVTAAYDLSLELMAAGLFGSEPRHPAIVAGWKSIAPRAPWLLAEDPGALLGSITNALYNLSLHDDARPDAWVEEMTAIAGALPDLASFRAAGHVLAWRCGMAEHREGALPSCRTLDAKLALRSLGVTDRDPSTLNDALDRLRADPWLTPKKAFDQSPAELRIVSIVGAFRGFGGRFRKPPKVFLSGGAMIAGDGESHWTLVADAFGSALLPLPSAPRPDKTKSKFSLSRDGEVALGDRRAKFDTLANATSVACDDTTLAVTIDRTHHIFLVALQ